MDAIKSFSPIATLLDAVTGGGGGVRATIAKAKPQDTVAPLARQRAEDRKRKTTSTGPTMIGQGDTLG